jgi:hypothetical protein
MRKGREAEMIRSISEEMKRENKRMKRRRTRRGRREDFKLCTLLKWQWNRIV